MSISVRYSMASKSQVLPCQNCDNVIERGTPYVELRWKLRAPDEPDTQPTRIRLHARCARSLTDTIEQAAGTKRVPRERTEQEQREWNARLHSRPPTRYLTKEAADALADEIRPSLEPGEVASVQEFPFRHRPDERYHVDIEFPERYISEHIHAGDDWLEKLAIGRRVNRASAEIHSRPVVFQIAYRRAGSDVWEASEPLFRTVAEAERWAWERTWLGGEALYVDWRIIRVRQFDDPGWTVEED